MKKSSVVLVVFSIIFFLGAVTLVAFGVKNYLGSSQSSGNRRSSKIEKSSTNDSSDGNQADGEMEGETYKKSFNDFNVFLSEAAPANGDWLCEFSASRAITDADMSAIISANPGPMPENKPVGQMVINEMYARHGYSFQTPSIQAYFDAKEWYRAINTRNPDMNQIYSGMSAIEKQNIAFLQNYN